MHPRNRYRENPADFGDLAEFRPSLKPYLIDKYSQKSSRVCGEEGAGHSAKTKFPYTLNFSDPLALRELTCAVLERDFGLKLDIPLGALIPSVPQKLNYIHWIEDLLAPVGVTEEGVALVPKGKDIVGIDVGTGTSCIYPLLGCKMNGWRFVATDITREAVEGARNNVNINNLEDSVEVIQVTKGTILEEVLESVKTEYSFTMCNPPFFKSKADKLGGEGSRSDSRPAPSTVSGGTNAETITEGGEVEFVKGIIKDSMKFGKRVKWYTSMLGKKANVKKVIAELKNNEVPVMMSTEFVQGRTWRWAIAWSLDSTLKDKVDELQAAARKRRRASGEVMQLAVKGEGGSMVPSTPEGVHEAKQWLDKWLQELEIDRVLECRCKSCDESCVECASNSGVCKTIQYQCHAHKTTWSHQRKKRRLLQKLSELSSLSTIGRKQSQNIETSESPAPLKDLQRKLEMEVESLSPACDVHFLCTISLVIPEELEGHMKKKKKTAKEMCERCDEEREVVVIELEWTGGDSDKDQLHQIMQNLNNKMNATAFNK